MNVPERKIHPFIAFFVHNRCDTLRKGVLYLDIIYPVWICHIISITRGNNGDVGYIMWYVTLYIGYLLNRTICCNHQCHFFRRRCSMRRCFIQATQDAFDTMFMVLFYTASYWYKYCWYATCWSYCVDWVGVRRLVCSSRSLWTNCPTLIWNL